MPNINIKVAEKIAINTTPEVVMVCGNSGYTVTFDLDAEWGAEPERTARFVYVRDGKLCFKEVDFTGSTVDVPPLYGVSYVLVGVYTDSLRTTTPARVECDRSILCVGGEEVLSPAEVSSLEARIAARSKPLRLNVDSANVYLEDPTYGDAALEAIKTGRQILVRVPNADGGSYTAIYVPVLMYQVPNYQNRYLYLFFLRDEKQDLSALVGLPAGSVLMPAYGELKLLLSQEYNSNPLETAE